MSIKKRFYIRGHKKRVQAEIVFDIENKSNTENKEEIK